MFVTATGKRWQRSEAWRALRRLARDAVPEKATTLHPHDLRHAFVTLSLDAGASLRDVQDAAGHADPDDAAIRPGRHNLDRHPTYALAGLITSSRHACTPPPLLRQSDTTLSDRAGSHECRLWSGLDGCPGGWVLVAASPESHARSQVMVVSNITGVLDNIDSGHVAAVGIDIPIGLPDTGSRACDIEARKMIGEERSSSFPHRYGD